MVDPSVTARIIISSCVVLNCAVGQYYELGFALSSLALPCHIVLVREYKKIRAANDLLARLFQGVARITASHGQAGVEEVVGDGRTVVLVGAVLILLTIAVAKSASGEVGVLAAGSILPDLSSDVHEASDLWGLVNDDILVVRPSGTDGDLSGARVVRAGLVEHAGAAVVVQLDLGRAVNGSEVQGCQRREGGAERVPGEHDIESRVSGMQLRHLGFDLGQDFLLGLVESVVNAAAIAVGVVRSNERQVSDPVLDVLRTSVRHNDRVRLGEVAHKAHDGIRLSRFERQGGHEATGVLVGVVVGAHVIEAVGVLGKVQGGVAQRVCGVGLRGGALDAMTVGHRGLRVSTSVLHVAHQPRVEDKLVGGIRRGWGLGGNLLLAICAAKDRAGESLGIGRAHA
jgi:hypothetical protein